MYQLFIEFKKTYDSVRREAFYNIIIEFGIPMKLVRLIRMCLNETYRRVQVGKHLCDTFSVTNVKKRRRFNAIAFQLYFRVRVCH